MSEECKEHLTKKPVFLPRSVRSYAKSPFGKMKQHNQHKAPPQEKDAAADKADKAKDGAETTTTDNAPSNQAKDENKEATTEDEEMPTESEKG